MPSGKHLTIKVLGEQLEFVSSVGLFRWPFSLCFFGWQGDSELHRHNSYSKHNYGRLSIKSGKRVYFTENVGSRFFDNAHQSYFFYFALKEVLEAFSEKAQADAEDQPFVTDEVLIKHGTPAEAIIETAREQDCGIIVVGTHGHGTFADVFVGSTAKWITKHSPIPVLVIRLP